MSENNNNWTEQLLALKVGDAPLTADSEHYDSINTTRKRIGKSNGYKYGLKQIQNVVYVTRKS